MEGLHSMENTDTANVLYCDMKNILEFPPYDLNCSQMILEYIN